HRSSTRAGRSTLRPNDPAQQRPPPGELRTSRNRHAGGRLLQRLDTHEGFPCDHGCGTSPNLPHRRPSPCVPSHRLPAPASTPPSLLPAQGLVPPSPCGGPPGPPPPPPAPPRPRGSSGPSPPSAMGCSSLASACTVGTGWPTPAATTASPSSSAMPTP